MLPYFSFFFKIIYFHFFAHSSIMTAKLVSACQRQEQEQQQQQQQHLYPGNTRVGRPSSLSLLPSSGIQEVEAPHLSQRSRRHRRRSKISSRSSTLSVVKLEGSQVSSSLMSSITAWWCCCCSCRWARVREIMEQDQEQKQNDQKQDEQEQDQKQEQGQKE